MKYISSVCPLAGVCAAGIAVVTTARARVLSGNRIQRMAGTPVRNEERQRRLQCNVTGWRGQSGVIMAKLRPLMASINAAGAAGKDAVAYIDNKPDAERAWGKLVALYKNALGWR